MVCKSSSSLLTCLYDNYLKRSDRASRRNGHTLLSNWMSIQTWIQKLKRVQGWHCQYRWICQLPGWWKASSFYRYWCQYSGHCSAGFVTNPAMFPWYRPKRLKRTVTVQTMKPITDYAIALEHEEYTSTAATTNRCAIQLPLIHQRLSTTGPFTMVVCPLPTQFNIFVTPAVKALEKAGLKHKPRNSSMD